MQSASLLRVLDCRTAVVQLDGPGSVVSINLLEPLTDSQLQRACRVSCFAPVSCRVTLGPYENNLFIGSSIELPELQPRRRANYSEMKD